MTEPPTEDEVKLAEIAATAGCLGLFGATLILALVRALFFHWSWWWLAAPLGVALLASAAVVTYAAAFPGRKGKQPPR